MFQCNVFSKTLLLCIVLGFIATSTRAATGSNYAVSRKVFDFVIGVNGDFKAALAAAGSAASSGKRFYIFFPNGDYNIGTLTGNSNQMTTITTSNLSFIGQSADSTVIFNKSSQEGISVTSTLYFNKADNLYLQDLSILNKATWNQPSAYSATGRHVAVMEQGDKIIYKNVKLLSTQDTYYTKGNRTYFENGEIHGTTDFICGGGDIFFNKVLLYINKISYITAPATSTSWGYVFMNCTIDGSVNSYNFGRSWNNAPKCVFINTTMKKQVTATAWGDPMNVVPSVFAEYNSKTASGALVDVSKRRTTYTSNGKTVTLKPILTEAQAAQYTVANVLKGSDNWQPDNLAKQVNAPVVSQGGMNLKWNDDENAQCWVVFKDNKYYKCVTSTGCEITAVVAKYTVRAANSMGGLGPSSNVVAADGKPVHTSNVVPRNFDGIHLNSYMNKVVYASIPMELTGATLNIVSNNGKVLYSTYLENQYNKLHLDNLANGTYVVQIVTGNGTDKKYQSNVTRIVTICQ